MGTELTEISFRGCIIYPFKTMLLDAYFYSILKLSTGQQQQQQRNPPSWLPSKAPSGCLCHSFNGHLYFMPYFKNTFTDFFLIKFYG